MPRRKKTYVAPGKTLVNGGRVNLPDDVDLDADANVDRIEPVELDVEHLRKRIKSHIQNYSELSQISDLDRFVDDLVDECAWAQTQGLQYLVKGARTKPDEWTAQIFACGLAAVMKRHGLRQRYRSTIAVSKYSKATKYSKACTSD
jgi:hypothetical protein